MSYVQPSGGPSFVWDLLAVKKHLESHRAPKAGTQKHAILGSLLFKGVSEYSEAEMFAFVKEISSDDGINDGMFQIRTVQGAWNDVFLYYVDRRFDGFSAIGLCKKQNIVLSSPTDETIGADTSETSSRKKSPKTST